jgi:hypothetical protein
MCFNNRVLGPKTSPSQQTKFAAEAHLAEGQFLVTEQTLNIGKSRIYVQKHNVINVPSSQIFTSS